MNFTNSSQIARGGGLGSVFGTLFRTVSPLVKRLVSSGARLLRSRPARKLARNIKKDAVSTGIKLASQALSGENIAKAAKENVKDFGRKAAKRTEAAISEATQPESKRRTRRSIRRRRAGKRRKSNYPPGSTKMPLVKTARSSDIFDADP